MTKHVVFVDGETYWDQEFTLSKLTPIEYCYDDRFEFQSAATKIGFDGETIVTFGHEDTARHFADIGRTLGWDNVVLTAHNQVEFDSLYLAGHGKDHFGLRPGMWADTLAMARPHHAKTCGCSLAALAKHYGLMDKGSLEATNTKGKRLADFTPSEREAMRAYNALDTDILAELFRVLVKKTSREDMLIIDRLTRMIVEPRIVSDHDLLRRALAAEQKRKFKLLDQLAQRLGVYDSVDPTATQERVRGICASATKFKELLVKLGAEVPMKEGKNGPIPALAKTDAGMQELLEHDIPDVAFAASVRLDVKSTLLENRIQRFLVAQEAYNGKMPIPLSFSGATQTGRLSGTFKLNMQNLPRINPRERKMSDVLRYSLKAPEDHQIFVADLSGIEMRINHFLWQVDDSMRRWTENRKADLYTPFAAVLFGVPVETIAKDSRERQAAKVCLAEGTKVLTDQGEIPIEHVTTSHRLWDGVEWVSHDGAVCNGEREVITYDGLTATPDHEVFTQCGRKISFAQAQRGAFKLACTGASGAPVGVLDAGRDSGALQAPVGQTKRRVWDILNAGPRNRFTANGRLVSNCHLQLGYRSGWQKLRDAGRVQGLDMTDSEAQSYTRTWRDQYHKIVSGWSLLDDVLECLHQGKTMDIDAWGLCKVVEGGIQTPGYFITYKDLHKRNVDNFKGWAWFHKRPKGWEPVHGGCMCENLCQSLAGQILKAAWVQYERHPISRECPVVHQVHDELIGVAPTHLANEALDILQGYLRTPPTWWPELVTYSEGGVGRNYGEAK